MAFLPDGGDLETIGLLFMTLVYGYILLQAAKQIGEGSELLLEHFGPGIVGGLVIPILGAIPDSMIILFSGLSGGTKAEMLSKLQIGLGTLAGSTVTLITLPWAGAVLLGWRDLDPINGKAQSKEVDGVKVPKADNGLSLWHSGVTVSASTAKSVWAMMATAVCYLIIQIPAAVWLSYPVEKQAEYEHIPALIGLIVSLLALAGYCIYQLRSSAAEENLLRKSEEIRIRRWQYSFGKTFGRFDNIVSETFRRMDRDRNGTLDPTELSKGLKLLGLPVVNKGLLQKVIKTMDLDGDGKVSFAEFRNVVKLWMHPYGKKNTERLASYTPGNYQEDPEEFAKPESLRESEVRRILRKKLHVHEHKPLLGKGRDQDEVEKIEEPGEDKYGLFKACWHLLVGVALALIFSDPMVAILGNLADKINIGSFYVSFVVTPLASNACEIVSALYFAKSKTESKVSMAISSLYGAACMNNTFCLAVFFLIIYINRLPWEFTSETICILLAETFIACLGYKRTIQVWKALVALLVYPLAIVFVAVWNMLAQKPSTSNNIAALIV